MCVTFGHDVLWSKLVALIWGVKELVILAVFAASQLARMSKLHKQGHFYLSRSLQFLCCNFFANYEEMLHESGWIVPPGSRA